MTMPAPVAAIPDLADLVPLRVRLRAQRRVAWLRSLWSRGSGAPAPGTAHAEIDAILEGWDDAEAERRWQSDGAVRALGEEIDRVDSLVAERGSRLARLATVFGLDTAESDYVQVCLAAALDASLGRVFAYLENHASRAYPTEALVARLFGHGLHRVLLPESPLRRWELIQATPMGPGEPDVLSCDPLVRDWLLGDHRLDEVLVPLARIQPTLEPLEGWRVEETAQRLRATLETARARVCVVGPPGSGRRTLAAGVAASLGLSLLVIDVDAVPDEDWRRVFLRAHRQAFLDGCALAWVGESAHTRRWPDVVTPFPLQFVIAEAGETPVSRGDLIDQVMEVPAPALAERRSLWRMHVATASSWSEPELAALISNHQVGPGEIAAVAARVPATAAEAAALVRESSRHRLGDLARGVECPFTVDDLVAPEPLRTALADFVFEARERAAFWEQPAARRLFPQGRGLFALFTGTPGTGKTMAAQVVAADLGLDLFRISLATVVSKYVGETAKNLYRILARAEAMDCVLLFDEADALFGKRTEIKDAHDRFANTDTNYLLQAIEAYRGIAILATNKKSNMDPAFTRRLRHVLEFARPDATLRQRLWERLIGELAGLEQAASLARAIAALAAATDMSGGQIKFAVLGALFAARRDGTPLTVRHLLYGVDRELTKEGRALPERERERVAGAAH